MSIFRKILKPFKNSCNIFNKTENVGNDTEVDCEVNMNNQETIYISNIFKKKSFTLKELCHYFLDIDINMNAPIQSINIENIRELCNCYLYFTSNNIKYKQYLRNIKENKHLIQINNVTINVRLIFQEFDFEFNKLIIGIRTEMNYYDNTVSWEQFNEKFKNFNKELLEQIFVHKE